jgi:hypothetical protein
MQLNPTKDLLMNARLILAATLSLFIVGCASVPMGNEARDAQLKTFAGVPKDKAGLYIYRNERMGGKIKMDVELNGQPIGQTQSFTYLYKEVAPGKHTLTSKSENTDTLTIDAKPGMLYYIWQEAKMGVLYARTKLHLVPEVTGKAGVAECSLAETR